ncbi:sugar kinase [Candidatus Sumerlaeota bacterium]|nr:sugar kinase [Candidatus Sumerlaeota bacterium]
MSLVIVGSIAVDSVETPYGKIEKAMGGSANFAGIASSLFTNPAVVGVVGEDYPKEYLQLMKKKKFDISGLKTIAGGKTFHWKGRYEGDMSHAITLSTCLNVFEFFKPELPPHYRDAKYIFLANIDPELQLFVLDQVKKPKLVLCDTMNFWITGRRDALIEVFKRSHVVLVNEGEARLLTGITNLIQAAEKLLALGPSHVIVKKGEHGAFLLSKVDYCSVPAFPLKLVKDPTGAGDTFAGGLIGFLASKNSVSPADFRRAMAVGTVLASFVCEDFSVNGTATLTKKKMAKRLEQFCKISQIPKISL